IAKVAGDEELVPHPFAARDRHAPAERRILEGLNGEFRGLLAARVQETGHLVLHLDDDCADLPSVDRHPFPECLRDHEAAAHARETLTGPGSSAEPTGLRALATLAHGVPVGLPRDGAFTEVAEASAGGLLADRDDPRDLATAPSHLANDDPSRAEFGRKGNEA